MQLFRLDVTRLLYDSATVPLRCTTKTTDHYKWHNVLCIHLLVKAQDFYKNLACLLKGSFNHGMAHNWPVTTKFGSSPCSECGFQG